MSGSGASGAPWPVPRHKCGPCDRGALSAGHCVDIDGDYWHDCTATRQADASPSGDYPSSGAAS